MDISSIRSSVDRSISVREYSIKQLSKHEKDLKFLTEELADHKKIRETYQQAAVSTQSYLEKHLSLIVTNALQSVFFEKDFQFRVKFDKKRNATECELVVIQDGEEYDIIEDKGFGVADIASFALRVAYVLLDSVDNVLILDEPLRHLDRTRMSYASKMIKELSHKLNMQFIIVTHSKELIEHADKIINIEYKNGESIIVA